MKPHAALVTASMRMSALVIVLASGLVGCARPAPRFNGLDVSAGRQLVLRTDQQAPPAQWAGSYYSPQLGSLALWQTGTAIEGRFRYLRGNVVVNGALDGELEGNLLRYHWRETHCTRPSFGAQGHGFFLFDPPQGEETRRRLFGHREYRVTISHMPMRTPVRETRNDGPIYATENDFPKTLPPLVCPKPSKAATSTLAN